MFYFVVFVLIFLLFFFFLFFFFCLYFFFFFFFFFFSSRRRHTRFDCDWSSDVCSSDLCATCRSIFSSVTSRRSSGRPGAGSRRCCAASIACTRPCPSLARRGRSEERRVGKECRARGWACH